MLTKTLRIMWETNHDLFDKLEDFMWSQINKYLKPADGETTVHPYNRYVQIFLYNIDAIITVCQLYAARQDDENMCDMDDIDSIIAIQNPYDRWKALANSNVFHNAFGKVREATAESIIYWDGES